MTLKHITRDIKVIKAQGHLSSVNYRTRQGQSINNRHTQGVSSRGEYIYFTLGLPEHRLQYWDSDEKPHTISIAIGKAYSEGKIEICPGLWIDSHISAQVASGHLPSKYFGDTLRSVSYTQDEKKQTSYRYQNGEEYCFEESRKSEIFSAENGLQNIFDALFYQILEEVHRIDGEFKMKLLKNEMPEKLLRLAFKHLFIPDVYPEAKLPVGLFNITQPYVSIETKPFFPQAISLLFNAIEKGNINTIQDILAKNPELLEAKIDGKTPLAKAVEILSSQQEDALWNNQQSDALRVINYLLNQGADFNVNDASTLLIEYFLKNNSEESLQILAKLLDGISDLESDLIRHSFHRQQMFGDGYDLLSKALRHRNLSAFELLLKHGVSIGSHRTILRALYSAYGHDNFTMIMDIIQRFSIDVNAVNGKGNTLLMDAASDGKEKFIQWWLDNFPAVNLNQQNMVGETALHLAVRKDAVAVVGLLLERGENFLIIENNGESAYSLAVKNSNTKQDKKYHKKFNQDILLLLEKHKAEFVVYPKSLEHTVKVKRFTVAALVARTTDNKKEFLFIRKKSNNGNPVGHFMFPGGSKDTLDKDDMVTCARKCLEETGIVIKPQSFYQFAWSNDEELHRCHFGYAEVQNAFEPIAIDDVAEALWINWVDVQKNEMGHYYYKGIPIAVSSALIIEAYLSEGIAEKRADIDDYLKRNIQVSKLLMSLLMSDEKDTFEMLVREIQIDISQQAYIAIAVSLNKSDWIPLLITLGADINAIVYSQGGYSALTIAVATENFTLAKNLIRQGANINLPMPNIIRGSEPLLMFLCGLPETENKCDFLKLLLETYHAKLSEDIGTKALIIALRNQNFKFADYLVKFDRLNYIDINHPCLIGGVKLDAVSTAISVGAVDFFQSLPTFGVMPELGLARGGLTLIEYELSKYFMCWEQNVPFFSLTNDISNIPNLIKMRAILFSYGSYSQSKNILVKSNFKFMPQDEPEYTATFLQNPLIDSLKIEQAHFLIYSVQEEQTLILFVREVEQIEWQVPFLDKAPLQGSVICYKFMLSAKERRSLVQYRAAVVAASDQEIIISNIRNVKTNCELKWISLEQIIARDMNVNLADIGIVRRYFSKALRTNFDPEIDYLIFQKMFVERKNDQNLFYDNLQTIFKQFDSLPNDPSSTEECIYANGAINQNDITAFPTANVIYDSNKRMSAARESISYQFFRLLAKSVNAVKTALTAVSESKLLLLSSEEPHSLSSNDRLLDLSSDNSEFCVNNHESNSCENHDNLEITPSINTNNVSTCQFTLINTVPETIFGKAEYEPALLCQAENYTIVVMPKISKSCAITASYNFYEQLPNAGDNFEPSSCHPVEFFGRPSVYCEGEKTTVVYTPHLQPRPFDNLDGNLMLGTVFLYLAKSAYQWFCRKTTEEIIIANMEEIATKEVTDKKLREFQDRLNKLELLISNVPILQGEDFAWVGEAIEENQETLTELQKKAFVTMSELDELKLDIDYLENEIKTELKYLITNKRLQTNTASYVSYRSGDGSYEAQAFRNSIWRSTGSIIRSSNNIHLTNQTIQQSLI